ncbi:Gamma-soluble NSF attachment protein [Nymphon striatum]|nr:Gamma-soluble NSF attachment protein [Nymphon striatum]
MRVGNSNIPKMECTFNKNTEALKYVVSEKDIGVTIDDKLTFDTCEKINKANSIMGVLRRTMVCMSIESFKLLYTSLVRPHIEYANQVWCPHLEKHIAAIENVQRRATKQVPGLTNLSYPEPTCFKAAKSMDQSKNCLLKAAECFMQNNSFFSAAKSYEQAAMVCRDMKDILRTGDLIEKACKLFQEHGSPDTAAMSLERGAKMIESSMPERALHLLQRAAEVVMLEDRPRQAAEYTSKVSRIFVKLQRFVNVILSSSLFIIQP